MEKASRYDIKCKKYIESLNKYYFADCGLRNARLNFRQIEYSHLLENVIYNELLARDFSVDVGVVAKNERTADSRERQYYEVDFVCNNGTLLYTISIQNDRRG